MTNTKRAVALLLALMMIFAGAIHVFAATQMTIAVISLPRAADTNKGDWGLADLYLLGGWETIATNSYLVYCKDSHSGQVVYCIEPGHGVRTGNVLTQESNSSYWASYPSSNNPTLEPSEIRTLLERVLQYGWHGNGNTSWDSTKASDAEDIAALIATQMLVWEVVVGERTSYFSHVDASRRGFDNVMDGISSGNPLYDEIWDAYDYIVSSIQNQTLIPSFMSDNEADANTYELVWDGTRYSVTLTDTNGVLRDCTFKTDSTALQCSISGNKITFYTTNANETEIAVVAEKEGTRKNVIVWSDGNICGGDQDVISYGTEIDDTVTGYLNLSLTPSAGTIKIIKTSEDGNVSGFSFILSGDGVNKTVSTDENGIAVIENLAPGTYTVTEVENDMYNPQEPKTVIVENGKTSVVEFYNTIKTGGIKIIKSSEDDKISGITFKVSGNGFEETVGTDENGIVTIAGLQPGKYTVTEETADGYEEQQPETVVVEGGKTAEVRFFNTLRVGSLKVIKTSEDGLVEGIRFKLSGTSVTGDTIEEYMVTDANGVAMFENIPIGSYTVEEMDTATKYVAPANQQINIVHNETTECTFNNVLKKFSLVLKKSDIETGGAQGGATLEGAVYGLYKGGELIESFTTGADGSFTTGYYVCGDDYTVKEIVPSKGYLLDETVYALDVSAESYTIERNSVALDVTEQVIKGSVQLTKVDKNFPENKLTGAEFEVYVDTNGNKMLDENDELLGKLTEAERGIYNMSGLVYGGYFVKETLAPKGFILDDNAYYFEITEDGKAVVVENEAGVGFVNESYSGSLKIVKTSSDGKVEGFSFRVKSDNGYDKTFTTNKNGEIVIENLRIGTYTISEIANGASSNYIMPAAKTATVIKDSVTKVEMHNMLRETPKTGDTRMPGLWLGIATISIFGAVTFFYLSNKKRKNER